MNVSRTRKFIANMGNWGEKYEASATVTMGHHDLGYSDEEWFDHVESVGTQKAFEELADTVIAAVDYEISDEIEEANRLRPEDADSFLDPKPAKKKSRRSR